MAKARTKVLKVEPGEAAAPSAKAERMREKIGPLTKDKINALEPKMTSYPVPEGRQRCLYLQVTPAGIKSWVLRYRFRGIQKTHTLGRWPDMTVDQAGKEAISALKGIGEGKDPNEARKEEIVEAQRVVAEQKTVSDLLDRYIRDHIEINNKESSQQEFKRLITKHVRPGLGSLEIRKVGTNDISQFLTEIQRETPTQCNRVRSLLITMFGRAEEWEMRDLGTNPVVPIKKRTSEVKRSRRLSAQELKSLGKTLNTSKESKVVIAAIRLYLLTGMRKSELIGDKARGIEALTWGRVNLKEKTLEVFTKSRKGKSAKRVVYCCSEAINILKSIPKIKNNPYVITGKNAKEALVGIQNAWERIRIVAKLAVAGKDDPDNPRIHDLRRTFSSVGADIGWKEYMRDLLGHAEKDVTDIYTRTDPAILLQVAEEVGSRVHQLLNGIAAPKSQPIQATARKAGQAVIPRKAGKAV